MANNKAINLYFDTEGLGFVDSYLSPVTPFIPPLRRGDTYDVRFHLLKKGPTRYQPFQYITIPIGKQIKLGIGKLGGKPTSGTFVAFVPSVPADVTAPLDRNISAADLQTALNALPSVTTAGGLVVTGTATTSFRIIWNVIGPVPVISFDSTFLVPTSEAVVSGNIPGAVAVNEVLVFTPRFQADWVQFQVEGAVPIQQTSRLFDDNTTSFIADALNSLPAVISAGGLTVTRGTFGFAGFFYTITWNVAGRVPKLTCTIAHPIDFQFGGTNGLVLTARGSVASHGELILRLATRPVAYSEDFTPSPGPNTDATMIYSGGAQTGDDFIVDVDLARPYLTGGSYSLRVNVGLQSAAYSESTPYVPWNISATDLKPILQAYWGTLLGVNFEWFATQTVQGWRLVGEYRSVVAGPVNKSSMNAYFGLVVDLLEFSTVYTGQLDLSSVGMEDALGGADSVVLTMEIEADSVSASIPVTIKNDLIKGANTPPVPNHNYQGERGLPVSVNDRYPDSDGKITLSATDVGAAPVSVVQTIADETTNRQTQDTAIIQSIGSQVAVAVAAEAAIARAEELKKIPLNRISTSTDLVNTGILVPAVIGGAPAHYTNADGTALTVPYVPDDGMVPSQKAVAAAVAALSDDLLGAISATHEEIVTEAATARGLENGLRADKVDQTQIDTDHLMAANSDSRVPSQKATRTAIAEQIGAEAVNRDIAVAAVAASSSASSAALDAHIADHYNPHVVTQGQVGLSNLTNDLQVKASQLDPDSTMAANSDLKVVTQKGTKAAIAVVSTALATHAIDATNPHAVTKTQVGLSAVTNDLQLKAAQLDTDVTLAALSDARVVSQKAIAAYIASLGPFFASCWLAANGGPPTSILVSVPTATNKSISGSGFATSYQYHRGSIGGVPQAAGTSGAFPFPVGSYIQIGDSAYYRIRMRLELLPQAAAAWTIYTEVSGGNYLDTPGPENSAKISLAAYEYGYVDINFVHRLIANRTTSILTVKPFILHDQAGSINVSYKGFYSVEQCAPFLPYP